MSAQNNGGPAFPSHGSMGEVVEDGMSLRDYFAAKAMQALIGSKYIGSNYSTQAWIKDFAAASAYGLADAMLTERSK